MYTMMRKAAGVAAAAVLVASGLDPAPRAAFAAETELAGATRCSVRSQSEAVAVVVCPPGLKEAALGEAGKRACGSRVVCNAWIWDDGSKAPRVAPASDAEIQKAVAASAVAVWANDTQSLLLIRPARR
jgi:hypothetical protein